MNENNSPLQIQAICDKALRRVSMISLWDEAEIATARRICRAHVKQLKKYRGLIQRDRRQAAKNLQEHILRGFNGKFAATLRVHSRLKNTFKSIKPISFVELQSKAITICPYSKPRGTAQLKLEAKADGSFRPTLSLGAPSRASQQLVLDVLSAGGMHNHFEFNTKGKGRDAALRQLSLFAIEHDIRNFVIFDVASWFPSLGPKHLQWLKVPKLVLEHAVFIGAHVRILHDEHVREVEAARRGLTMGAMLSGKIASAFLGRELSALFGDEGTFTFVDDGVVCACSRADAKTIAETLKSRFGEHPGGPLNFKVLEVSDIEKGFSFLGTWVQLNEDSVQLRPSHAARAKFKYRLFQKLDADEASILGFDAAVERGMKHLHRWMSSCSEWRLNREYEETWLYTLIDDYFAGLKRKPGMPPRLPWESNSAI